MTQEQIQQDISIIKKMIEKTRREVADSGQAFIFIGLASIIYVVVIMLLERYHYSHLVLPAMIIMTVMMGILGYVLIGRSDKNEKVKSYPKTVAYTVLFACSVPILLITFLFPLTGVYSFSLVPVLAALFFGVMLFSIGAIYEMPFLFVSSIAVWVGACIMAYIKGPMRGGIMIVIIILGFILPGIILNKKYKQRSIENES